MSAGAALVTGASYGVGAATAIMLAERGFDVAVTATKVENLDATMDSLTGFGVRTMALALDLKDIGNVRQVVSAAAGKFSGLSLLVNNAAAIKRMAAVEVSPEDWSEIVHANMAGTYFATTEFGRLRIEAELPGSVVSVGSTHGLFGGANQSLYGISKGGIIQMTRLLAIEWAGADIRVNAVAPGRLDTPSPQRAATASDAEYMKSVIERIPLHRLTTAKEVAAAICFLGGPESHSTTGQILTIDGGFTAA